MTWLGWLWLRWELVEAVLLACLPRPHIVAPQGAIEPTPRLLLLLLLLLELAVGESPSWNCLGLLVLEQEEMR